MLTEKQLYELIKALQSSTFTTTQIIFLTLGILFLAIIFNYVLARLNEKAKIQENNANYERLKKQLIENTEAIKGIDKKISSELWISQQVWQKKYELYENIYSLLFNIKKWVDYESGIIDLHMAPHYMANSYQPYFTAEQEEHFWQEIKEAQKDYDTAVNAQETKEKGKKLQQKLLEAMTSLAEVMITKSIILNPKVTSSLKIMIAEIGHDPFPYDYEEPDAYGDRINTAIDGAIEAVKQLALEELQIVHRVN